MQMLPFSFLLLLPPTRVFISAPSLPVRAKQIMIREVKAIYKSSGRGFILRVRLLDQRIVVDDKGCTIEGNRFSGGFDNGGFSRVREREVVDEEEEEEGREDLGWLARYVTPDFRIREEEEEEETRRSIETNRKLGNTLRIFFRAFSFFPLSLFFALLAFN